MIKPIEKPEISPSPQAFAHPSKSSARSDNLEKKKPVSQTGRQKPSSDKPNSNRPKAFDDEARRQSQYLRKTLDDWRASKGLRWAHIAKACNFRDANRFYNLINDDRKFSLSLAAYLSISKAYNVSIDELVGNSKFRLKSSDNPGLLVLCKAQIGTYQPSPYLSSSEQYRINLPCEAEDILRGAYCVEHYPPENARNNKTKELLIVRPFTAHSDHLTPGQTVIALRTNQKGVEVIVGIIGTHEADLTLELPGGVPTDGEVKFVVKKDGRIVGTKGKNLSIQAVVLGRWETFTNDV